MICLVCCLAARTCTRGLERHFVPFAIVARRDSAPNDHDITTVTPPLSPPAAGAFQLANALGVAYGVAMLAGGAACQAYFTFPLVAISRQLVYSTVFHEIAEVFGFANFGLLLGTTNVVVSIIGFAQFSLVGWAAAAGSYRGANIALVLATLPFFAAGRFLPAPATAPQPAPPPAAVRNGGAAGGNDGDENAPLAMKARSEGDLSRY